MVGSLYLLSPLSVARAAPPGSLTITTVGCYPAISVDIRVSLLATGGSKSNVLHLDWSDGTSSTVAPDMAISQDSYAGSSQTDVYHIDWLSEPTTSTSPFTATATATLSWVWANGNTKDVATTTETQSC
jgi:hypothetical protein